MNCKKWMAVAIVLCGFGVTSCSDKEDVPKIITVPEDTGGHYVTRTVPVVYYEAPEGSVTLRFYDDMPSVAYISIRDFHKMMLPGDVMTVSSQGGVYQLRNSEGEATVNVYDDTFSSNDYMAFTNLMSKVTPGMPNVYCDGEPYIKYRSCTISPSSVKVTFNLKQYGIDLHGDGKDVYFPFATLSDLYSDLHYNLAGFNGEKVVVNESPYMGTMCDVDSTFTIATYMTRTTTDDMAAFRYKELCFAIDNFYGLTGRSPYEGILVMDGLDAVLEGDGEAGRQVKQLLNSKNTAEYALGMDALLYYIKDYGHTKIMLDYDAPVSVTGDFSPRYSVAKATYPLAADRAAKAQDERFGFLQVWADLTEQRSNQLGDDDYYKVGNTAFYHLEDFMDLTPEPWAKYYAGGKKPTVEDYPDCQSVSLIHALDKANADPEVENFVLDLTTNGGGSDDFAIMLMSLLADVSTERSVNTMTGQKTMVTFDVDRNFDRKFDEKDRDVHYDLKVGVLTSRFSFSCANLFPSLMKDLGFLVMGERSGGGGCAIQQMVTPDGFDYRISSFRCLSVNNKWESIDAGVEPNVAVDPQRLYDVQYLGNIIERWYAKK